MTKQEARERARELHSLLDMDETDCEKGQRCSGCERIIDALLEARRGGMEETMKEWKEVDHAIKVLLRSHMNLDYEGLPIINMGAVPLDWEGNAYAQAWLLLWEKFSYEAQAVRRLEKK